MSTVALAAGRGVGRGWRLGAEDMSVAIPSSRHRAAIDGHRPTHRGRENVVIAFLASPRSSRWELLAANAAVAVAGVMIARTSFFFVDDFLFGTLFVESPLTPALLMRSIFGNLQPALVLLMSLYYRSVGLNWPVSATVMVLLLVAGSVAVTRLLDALLGPRRVGALAGAGFGLSLSVLTLLGWWSAVYANLVPLSVSIAFLGSLTRWDATGRARHLISAVLLYTLAVLWYERSLVWSLYALAWTLLVLDAGQPFRVRVRRELRRWALWVPVGAVSAAWSFVYLVGDYRAEAGPTAALGRLVGFVLRGVLLGLVPSIFGLDLSQPEWSTFVVPLAVVANVVAFSFIAWTMVRAPRTRAVWLFVWLVILLGEIPIALGRAGVIGIAGGRGLDGGRLLRYQIEGAFFLIVGASIALVRVREVRKAVAPRSGGARPVRAVVAGALAVVVVGAAWGTSAVNFVHANPGTAARSWANDFRENWPTDRTVTMVDGPLPFAFALDLNYPYSMASRTLPRLVNNVTFTTSVENAWAMGPDGIPGPFAFDASQEWLVGRCTDGAQPVTVAVDNPSTAPRQLLVTYEAVGAGAVQIVAGVGEVLGDPSGLSPVFTAIPGGGAFVMTVRPGTTIDTVRVASAAPGFCVGAVSVGVSTGHG